MKTIKLVFLIVAALFATQSHALSLTAKMLAWEPADARIAMGASGAGGVGEFQITGGDILPPELNFLIEQATFKALCTEPFEFVSAGQENFFNIIPIQQAAAPGGPPGTAKSFGLMSVMEQNGVNRIEDLNTGQKRSIAQIATWEALNEWYTNPFDPTGGDVVIEGIGLPQTNNFIANIGPSELNGWILQNWGPNNEPKYIGQDFMVTAVPIPAAAWLFGSAIVGLTVVARRKKV